MAVAKAAGIAALLTIVLAVLLRVGLLRVSLLLAILLRTVAAACLPTLWLVQS